ncbi:MAG TPA: hypothetical protein VF132_10420 [Rudaea sp.]
MKRSEALARIVAAETGLARAQLGTRAAFAQIRPSIWLSASFGAGFLAGLVRLPRSGKSGSTLVRLGLQGVRMFVLPAIFSALQIPAAPPAPPPAE